MENLYGRRRIKKVERAKSKFRYRVRAMDIGVAEFPLHSLNNIRIYRLRVPFERYPRENYRVTAKRWLLLK